MSDRLQKHFDARKADAAERKQRRQAESAVEQASSQFHREFDDLRDGEKLVLVHNDLFPSWGKREKSLHHSHDKTK